MLSLIQTLITYSHKTPTSRFCIKRNRKYKFSSTRFSLDHNEANGHICSEESEERWRFPVIKERKRVVLVRHGQSTWNEAGRIQGSSNFSVLTEKGEGQAETSRKMLVDDTFDVCFASPLNRSKRTADVIWGTRDSEIILEPELREIDLYSFQGLVKSEGEKRFGDAFQQWKYDPSNFIIDGHYPVRELWDRARNCWSNILIHESNSVLVVAHNAVNQALIATAMGLGPGYFRRLLQSNCGVSVLDFTPRNDGRALHICLNRLNQTPSSPIAVLNSESKRSYKRIILVCDESTECNGKSQKTAELLKDLKVRSILCSPEITSTKTATVILKVQEAADCLDADSAPQNVELKQVLDLKVDQMLSQLNMFSEFQPSCLIDVDDEIRTQVWSQTERAWNSIANELSDESTFEQNVVVVGHPAVHIALLGHCLNLKKERLGSFHLDGGSVSVIDFPNWPARRGVIRCVNYTAHQGRFAIPVTTGQ